MRVVQIAIGVATALAVALIFAGRRSAARFDAACAALLRKLAGRLDPASIQTPRGENEAEVTSTALRAALARLVWLADSADREAGFFRFAPAGRKAAEVRRRRMTRVTGRVLQDTAVLSRLLATLPDAANDPAGRTTVRAARAALAQTADAIAGKSPRQTADLDRLIAAVAPSGSALPGRPAAAELLAGPVRLLVDDLRELEQCTTPP